MATLQASDGHPKKEPLVHVIAVSEFMRTLFIILVATPFILLWAAALLDLIRGHHSGWGIVGWMLVIFVIPILGPMLYFALRKPTRDEVDQQYLAARELDRARAAHPTGGIGMAP
jgi:phospholipase D-like protein